MFVRERVRTKKDPHTKSSHKGMQTSSSIMRGTRLFRGGLVTDLVLLVVFIILAYVFIARRSGIEKVEKAAGGKGPFKVEHGTKGANVEGSSQHLIDARVKKVPDYRTTECRSKRYTVKDKVSIITVFFDYSFHDMKATLSSVLANTPMDLVEEILVVDDASTLEYIVDKSKAYIPTVAKAKLIRNDKQLSVHGARQRGSREARAEIIVFLSAGVVVANGWLEPLISEIQSHPKSIAIPHFDSINDPVSYEYKPTQASLIASISWSLSVRMTTTSEINPDTTAAIASPGSRGSALAVRKDAFNAIGGYDEGFQDGGGSDLELSLRTWLCGSKVKVCPCSRIGVVNLQDPVKVVSPNNIRRIAELWFSGRQSLVFRNTGVTEGMSEVERKSFVARKSQLHKLNLKCESIQWFFKNIAGNLPTPSEKAMKFGVLKSKTGRCAAIAEDKRLELVQCKTEHFNKPSNHMVFELTDEGLFTVNGQCLTVQPTAYILLEDCTKGETKQKWAHKDRRLINEWSQYCMMHVTDPDKRTGGKRQIAMAQDCSTAPDPQFHSFDFVTI